MMQVNQNYGDQHGCLSLIQSMGMLPMMLELSIIQCGTSQDLKVMESKSFEKAKNIKWQIDISKEI